MWNLREAIRRNPRPALLIVGLLTLVGVVFVLPLVIARPRGAITAAERLKAENDVRTTLVQMAGGAALLYGAYFTARTFRLNA